MNSIDSEDFLFQIAAEMLLFNSENFSEISKPFYNSVVDHLIKDEQFELVSQLKKIDIEKIKDISFEEMMESITIIPFEYNLN